MIGDAHVLQGVWKADRQRLHVLQVCGKNQNDDSSPTNEAVLWESCEIVYAKIKKGGLFGADELRFWAEAVGSNGRYNAGESTVFLDGTGIHSNWPSYSREYEEGL
jgi:hypothetical protein